MKPPNSTHRRKHFSSFFKSSLSGRQWDGSFDFWPPPASGAGGGGGEEGEVDFVAMVNAQHLSGLGATMAFYLNDTLLYTLTVTDEGTAEAGPEYHVARSDAAMVEHSGFLDNDAQLDIGSDMADWAGVDSYTTIDPALLLDGLNEVSIVVTAGAGFTNGSGYLAVVRCEYGADWEYAGEEPILLVDLLAVNNGGGETEYLYFMSDGTPHPPEEFTFVQDDADNFTYDYDASRDFPQDTTHFRMEFSWDGVSWEEYWVFNNLAFGPATEPNYEPSDPTFTPVPFEVGETYYMRARFQNHATTPTNVSGWTTRSFVAV
jgi:hypothetical protein